MNKKILSLVVLSVISVLAISIVSAGWFGGAPKVNSKSGVSYSPSSFGLNDLANGVQLKKGWSSYYKWDDKEVVIKDAVANLDKSFYYVYEYNPVTKKGTYWYNPKLYPSKVNSFDVFKKGNMYAIYANKAVVWKYAEVKCEDSDGGLNYGVEGNASVLNSHVTFDYCVSEKVLGEATCNSATPSGTASSDYDCSSEGKVCKDGACVSEGSSSSGEYYTKAEMSVILNKLQTEIDAIEQDYTYNNKVLGMLGECDIERLSADNVKCKDVCTTLNQKCILGMIHIIGVKDGIIQCDESGKSVMGNQVVGDIDTDCLCCSP